MMVYKLVSKKKEKKKR